MSVIDSEDFGQFIGEAGVGDKARRVRPDQDAGYEIADQRRNSEAIGESPEDESQPQTGDDGGDEGRVMRHCLWRAFQGS